MSVLRLSWYRNNNIHLLIQRENTNSKGDFVLKNPFKIIVLNISGTQK